MYPNTPVVTVVAPLIEAADRRNGHFAGDQPPVADRHRRPTRIVRAAQGGAWSAISAPRRAHNIDSAVYRRALPPTSAAWIPPPRCWPGRCLISPVSGTMAHSWVMFYPDEYTAFEKLRPAPIPTGCTLLVDTYDVLESGVPNAIRVAKEVLEPMGKRPQGASVWTAATWPTFPKNPAPCSTRAGLTDCKIVASNSPGRDDHLLPAQSGGEKSTSSAWGERLITARAASRCSARCTSW